MFVRRRFLPRRFVVLNQFRSVSSTLRILAVLICALVLSLVNAHACGSGGSAETNIPVAGGDFSFLVFTDPGCSWTISTTAGWITFPNGNAGLGAATVSFHVGANATTTPRQGIITVRISGGNSVTAAVVQNSSSCSFAFTPPSAAFPATGGNGNFTIQSSPAGCW